ncbi:tellurite resistance protein TerB [bacterium BMS3Bbin10]|nr:tellurite resistance protein TerB [bacterium BMS3Bbin10]
MTKLTHHEALVYVMVAMAAVDRTMTDAEFTRIGQMVSHLPIFADFDIENLVETAKKCGEILSSSEGLDETLDHIGSGVPDKLRATAYALAVEVAAADFQVKPEELRFLALLGEQMKLDKLTMAAIERGAKARLAIL